MPNYYRRCKACGQPDVTTRYREDMLVVLCVTCHVDARREPETRQSAPVALRASVADLVTYSPAALRAMREA